ncbi:MAG: hypothetical protein L6V93_04800 [Clostridiales bacterium]|nr:MAG: hypothetical protein L6V93_04800 [Clostridiales bacterium]
MRKNTRGRQSLTRERKMPSRKFYQSTYAIIGAGHKGICYYQWRGTVRVTACPRVTCADFLHTDGTKTDAFDRDIKLLKYLNGFSDKIVKCEKKRTHIAVLHSDYGYAYADALTDNLMGGVNIWQYITVSICKKSFISSDLTLILYVRPIWTKKRFGR